MNKDFIKFRKQYPVFTYSAYHIEEKSDELVFTFDFSIDGLCEFHPTTRIVTKNLDIINSYKSDYAQRLAFFLGMAEVISYWKCACPPTIKILCGELSEEDKKFFKHLWWGGLGEFFFRNGIETDEEAFVKIEAPELKELPAAKDYKSSGIEIIPIGGGKDSVVTTELMKKFSDKLRFFTVNDQKARTDCVIAGGYSEDKIIKTYRTIDRELLNCNAKGFLNGHTPFSSVVAFLSLYCGYLIGADDIILSNEASANDSNIDGASVNHQYSKSFEFENDFDAFRKRNCPNSAKYFSLLRPFNELQIAKRFALACQYHSVFRSCNAGSKKNIWCANCAKCLFVAIILSAFLKPEELNNIFGCDMLDKKELTEDFDGLCAFSGIKPFECVGTSEEVIYSLTETVKHYREENRQMPYLLKRFDELNKTQANPDLLKEWNSQNLIPEKFMDCVKEMYDYVSAAR